MSVEGSALNVGRSGSAGRAVFLSYASQDAEAARRIADGLRAFGLEVWFDQAELRGGDVWDASIRQQIRECALFVPIVSANTQARREGYFRREWNLAVERILDMAHGTPFLVPVVVDDTPESRALVPEQFMRVQWTRLPQGMPDPKFVAQVKRLLGSMEQGAWSKEPEAAGSEPMASPVRPARFPKWIWAAVAVVVAGGVVALWSARRGPGDLQVNDRAIAVLPFTNLSDDRENAYFADGMHEDLLTTLTPERGLRVVSRTSVMQYRDTRPSMREIAQKLNVAYILEGSVRGRGSKVRVTVQLIDARTDGHVWAQTYDRDPSDIFATQTELATEIAAELKTRVAQR